MISPTKFDFAARTTATNQGKAGTAGASTPTGAYIEHAIVCENTTEPVVAPQDRTQHPAAVVADHAATTTATAATAADTVLSEEATEHTTPVSCRGTATRSNMDLDASANTGHGHALSVAAAGARRGIVVQVERMIGKKGRGVQGGMDVKPLGAGHDTDTNALIDEVRPVHEELLWVLY